MMVSFVISTVYRGAGKSTRLFDSDVFFIFEDATLDTREPEIFDVGSYFRESGPGDSA